MEGKRDQPILGVGRGAIVIVLNLVTSKSCRPNLASLRSPLIPDDKLAIGRTPFTIKPISPSLSDASPLAGGTKLVLVLISIESI